MLKKVDEKIVDKWMPLIEGKGKWSQFVSACPKIQEKDYASNADLFETLERSCRGTLTDDNGKLIESTQASAIGDYSPILIPMLRRVMPAMIGPQIFGHQPLNGPSGLIFALRATFQNDSVNTLTRATSVILTVASGTNFTVGGDITGDSDNGNDGVGVVRHKEGNNLLVEVVSGTFVVANGVDNANPYSSDDTTISAVYENEALFNVIFSNYSGSYATATGEALSTNMKEVGFEIETSTATAKTRKLKAKWTNELEEDLRAVHNMNAEALLSTIASDEIVMEMNREFIDKVIANVGSTTAYNYTSADGRWELEKYQNLMTMIARVKRQVAVANKRGQATFAIVSPAVLSVLESSGKLDTNGVDPIQTVYAGKAMGLSIFVDLYAASDSIYLGYKGSTEVDAGVFYSPYVPLQVRKGQGEEDAQPRTFFSTRYAVTDNPYGATNYYKEISVANLPS